MAKKIIGGVGGLLGIGKKKKKAAEPTVTADGKPIITQLSALPADSPLRKKSLGKTRASDVSTMLGISGTLGQ